MVSPGLMGAIVGPISNFDMRVVLMAVAGASVGVYLFIRGFLMLRYKRMIENTPASKIRSASMGLVELSGMAEGPQTIPAGITGEACFYYRAIAWQLEQSGRNRQWKKVADESLYVPFFINDSTGRMSVDAEGADMEVTKNFHDEFNSSFFSSRDMLPENVGKFLARNGVLGGDTVRVEERCVKPGYPLFVFGTLAPHSTTGVSLSWVVKPHVCGSFVGLDVTENFMGALRKIPGLQTNGAGDSGNAVAAAAIRNRTAPGAAASTTRTAPVWSSVSIDEVEMAHGGTKAALAVAPDEPAAVPHGDRDATPVEIPGVPGAICKGADGSPFMISSDSQREVARALGWKSALFIWGGPILALISVYYLLVYLRLT